MSYRLVKRTSKTAEQEWKLYMNILFSLGRQPSDPRDTTLVYTESEWAIYLAYRTECCKVQPGYEGWTREYLDDNTVEMTCYFDTEANARNYRPLIEDPENSYYVAFSGMMQSKNLPPYTITWQLIDPQGAQLAYEWDQSITF